MINTVLGNAKMNVLPFFQLTYSVQKELKEINVIFKPQTSGENTSQIIMCTALSHSSNRMFSYYKRFIILLSG